MDNLTITANDVGSVEAGNNVYQDDTLAFAGADTWAAGTILGRTTATGKLGLYAIAGAGGLEIPVAVLTYEVVATGAGDKPARVLVSGDVIKERLIIDADGDDSNITAAEKDKLRKYGIVAISRTELNQLDNS